MNFSVIGSFYKVSILGHVYLCSYIYTLKINSKEA